MLLAIMGAGLGLLAFLGVGEEGRRIDYMAHCWGFVAGTVEGAGLEFAGVKARVSPRAQKILAWGALGLIVAAWAIASLTTR